MEKRIVLSPIPDRSIYCARGRSSPPGGCSVTRCGACEACTGRWKPRPT